MSRQDLPRQPPPRMPADGRYTPEQAAHLLGIPAHVIRRWARAGRLAIADELPAAVPGGRQRLYALAELRPLAADYLRRHAPVDGPPHAR